MDFESDHDSKFGPWLRAEHIAVERLNLHTPVSRSSPDRYRDHPNSHISESSNRHNGSKRHTYSEVTTVQKSKGVVAHPKTCLGFPPNYDVEFVHINGTIFESSNINNVVSDVQTKIDKGKGIDLGTMSSPEHRNQDNSQPMKLTLSNTAGPDNCIWIAKKPLLKPIHPTINISPNITGEKHKLGQRACLSKNKKMQKSNNDFLYDIEVQDAPSATSYVELSVEAKI